MWFFNLVIPTKIFPQSRNPDGSCRFIPIPNIRSENCLTEVRVSLIFGEPVEDGGMKKVVRSTQELDRVELKCAQLVLSQNERIFYFSLPDTGSLQQHFPNLTS